MKQFTPLLLLVFFIFSAHAQTQVFDISDPVYNLDHNNAQVAIQAAFADAQAYAQNNNNAPTKVYIPAGTYYLQLGSSTLIATSSGPHNLTIEGAGMNETKLIAEGFDSKLFSIIKTDNVTIKGMTLTRIGTPFFQGTVEQQLGNNKILVRRSTGFESPIVLDAASGSQHTLWKITGSYSDPESHPDMRSKKKIKTILPHETDPDLFIFSGSKWSGIFDTGERVVMKAKYGNGMISSSRADNITIEDITIINTGASAIRIKNGEKEFTVRNVHVKRGDAVNALGEVPYYTCGGGGFSFTHGNGVSIMENCTIEGTGDDPFSIHTYDSGDASNPPHLTVRNNTFKDVHGDLYLAELHNAEFYDNTIIRTNLQITNRSNTPSHNIIIRNNEFVENVRSGTIRISGLPDYHADTTQWHHDIDIYENTFTNTGSATSIIKFQTAKNITFRDNIIDGFTNVNLFGQTSPDPALIDFDNLVNYNPNLINSLQGENNCIINTTENDFSGHQTNILENITNSNICIDFCADPNGDNSNMCQALLPLELIYFSGTNTAGFNLLKWATAEPLKDETFIIEHSIDGSTWSILELVSANSNRAYAFKHRTPESSWNYYRLKSIASDNKPAYSPIVAVFEKAAIEAVVFPNPNDGSFTLAIDEESYSFPITIGLTNAQGQQVLHKKIEDSTNKIPLKPGNLEAGIYYLTIQSATNHKTISVVIR